MAQISTVLIPCLVVQMNNTVFSTNNGIIGRVENVDCRNVLVDKVLYWASPVKDFGVFEGAALQYRLVLPPNEDQPTYDSFLVQRVRDKISGYTWWIYVTADTDQFVASCETCCGDSAVDMPGTKGEVIAPILIAPCQILCPIDSDGTIAGIFGLPVLEVGQHYYPKGSYSDIAFPTASPTGYASASALVTFLNAQWNVPTVSPAADIVWAVSSDKLTLTGTGGFEGDSMCVTVIAITP